MKVTSLRYLDAKFHHSSLGASPPNRGNRISCVQNSRKTENRNSVNNSGIGILCSKNSNGRLAFPAVAGLLVLVTYHWDWVGDSVMFSMYVDIFLPICMIPEVSLDYTFLNHGSRDWEKGSVIAIHSYTAIPILFTYLLSNGSYGFKYHTYANLDCVSKCLYFDNND